MSDFPHAPVNEAPGGYADTSTRAAALHEPLVGIELGTYDERILRWLAEIGDNPTVMTIVSLLHRARAAQPIEAADTAAKTVLIETDETGTLLVVCPHDDCGAQDSIREVDAAVRFNDLRDARLIDERLVVAFNNDDGPDWSHSRFECSVCNRAVRVPENAEVTT